MTGSRSARHPNSHAHLRMSPTATAPSGPNRQSLEGDRGATTTVCAVRACRAAHVQFTGAPLRLFVLDRSRGPFTTGDRQLLSPSVMREGVFAWAGGAAGVRAVRQYKAHGMIGSATGARFAARGWSLYAVGIGLTAACGVLYLALRGLVLLIDAWPGDMMQQHYFCFYVSVLSALLIHYYFDHFLFLRIAGVITPRRSVLNQRAATP